MCVRQAGGKVRVKEKKNCNTVIVKSPSKMWCPVVETKYVMKVSTSVKLTDDVITRGEQSNKNKKIIKNEIKENWEMTIE